MVCRDYLSRGCWVLLDGFLTALVLGLTEFVLVSSTGHLILAGSILGFTGQRAATFEVFIQLGAILAVVVLYRDRLLALFYPSVAPGFGGTRGLGLLALTTAPSLILGALAHDLVKARLFTPSTVAVALALGGADILVAERLVVSAGVADLGKLTWRHALVVGLCQAAALRPGISRSAATIVGGMLSGLDRRLAVEYSFLAAVPVMLAATTFDLYRAREALGPGDLLFFGLGFRVTGGVVCRLTGPFWQD